MTDKADRLAAPVFLARLIESPRDWRSLLGGAMPKEEAGVLHERTRTGRPLGAAKFVERLVRCRLRRRKPGPKAKTKKAPGRGREEQ